MHSGTELCSLAIFNISQGKVRTLKHERGRNLVPSLHQIINYNVLEKDATSTRMLRPTIVIASTEVRLAQFV